VKAEKTCRRALAMHDDKQSYMVGALAEALADYQSKSAIAWARAGCHRGFRARRRFR